MICIIALVIFGVLGIFSASHRRVAKEAFDCVFKRITLRKCETGFDQKMKSKVTSSIMKRSPKLAAFIYKHFELLSWIFTILMIISIILMAISIYNYVVFGNCNGPNNDQFCIFNPLGGGGQGGYVCNNQSNASSLLIIPKSSS